MTYTHLTIGTSKIPAKPPRSNPPCTEPIVYGANILRDPGFELHLANTGGGPQGDELPSWYYSDDGTTPLKGNDGVLHWSNGAVADSSLSGWFQSLSTAGFAGQTYEYKAHWFVSDADPHSGTYHLKSGPGILGMSPDLRIKSVLMLGVRACYGTGGDNYGRFYSARVEPGDYVGISTWAKQTEIDGGTPLIDLTFYWHDSAGTQIGSSFLGNTTLTTSYAQYAHSAFAPPSTSFVLAEIYIAMDTTTPAKEYFVHIDDCVLEVQE